MYLFETERLYLREMTAEDAENAYNLNRDPEVLKYTGDEPFESIEEARTFLANYDHYHRYGFGRWAVIRKSDQAFLGWCGLKYNKDTNEFDIGFRFKREFWNQGFATEAALVCLHAGFTHYDMPFIVGHVMQENIGSICVLEKIGLMRTGPYVMDGEAGYLYGLSKEDYLKKKTV